MTATPPLHPAIQEAYGVLDGTPITRNLALQLAAIEGPDILDLMSLANKTREAFSPDTHLCTILNAKSGQCSQDCRFCAQSAHHETVIDEYGLLDVEEIVAKAGVSADAGVKNFGIVTSGYGFPDVDETFRNILSAIDKIEVQYPDLGICASLGVLSEETVAALATRNIVHYNINLQTNPDRYDELIASTHSVDERIETIRLLQKHGIGVCSGGIIGVGESMEDRVDLAFRLKELDSDVIPLNVLVPIEGTPLANSDMVPVAEIAKTFAIFRLVNPGKVLKLAAGRETIMKDFQGLLMLSGMNGFLTGGYLTTRGRDVASDCVFKDQLDTFSGPGS
jgi:biotin synthase